MNKKKEAIPCWSENPVPVMVKDSPRVPLFEDREVICGEADEL